jgi:DNA-binding transcriptional ArsR family regulator
MSNGSKKELEKQELVFKALADYRRREILDLLKAEARTTGDLCLYFKDLDRCTVMQHLSVLEKADLVIVKREGRHRWNYINPLPIKDIYDRWISRYATHAMEILARMKHDLEEN